MKSVVLFTEEIDDMEAAMEELEAQLQEKDFTYLEHTCGIAFCDCDMDVEALAEAVSETFDFPVMGGTALAMMTKNDGYQVSGISLMILTADDCRFHMAMTEPLDVEDPAGGIQKTYRALSAQLEEKEKLIYVLGAKRLENGGDVYVDAFSEVAQGIPVYGALASDRFNFDDRRIFCNGRVEETGLSMLLITGNIQPIIQSEFSLNHMTSYAYQITSCKGSVVYALDGKPFMDVLEEMGLKSRQDGTDNVIMEFLGTPFLMVEKMENGDEVKKLRNLTDLNQADKSGKFLGDMVEGAVLHIGLIRKEDVQISVEQVFKRVLAEMEQSDAPYSTFLCNSCGSRYLILATEPDAEARAYRSILPDNVDLTGLYSYGEICPQMMGSGKIYNCFLNDTFTILVM